ncbi:hypothetical protein WA845_25205, partial [Agrobacterium sp. CMT1]|uniref:hypothetical protein n=1 Tax=Agrobacterium sp. CMT1 TaxID=3128901 RepID=UPI003077623E
PEMKNAIEIKTNELKSIKDPATEISMKDYLRICTEMHDKVKGLGIDGLGASATKAPKASSRQPASTSTSDGKKDKLMNAPPTGKYAKKHVEEWKNHKTQRTANGACSYCGPHGQQSRQVFSATNHHPFGSLWRRPRYNVANNSSVVIV